MPADRLSRRDGPRPATGIVHLGLGAFFRAFGCIYIAEAMQASGGDWGITGVSLRSTDTRDALAPQGWAYTAVSLAPDGPQARQIDVLNDVLVAPEDPQAVLDAMTDPAVRIVSLTVTEKGYCHHPAYGTLDHNHPDIIHDIANDLPRSAPGYIVRALQRRRAAGYAPFTVLCCDNLPGNGALVRGIVLDLARQVDPALADWIAAQGRFPATMVDRITPATTADDIASVPGLTGRYDAAPVMHEPFRQWAVQDDFVGGARPDLAAAGAQMVDDVTAFEHMKLRMLNGTHSALAYLGYLAGHQTIADTVADPVFKAYVQQCWAEIMPTVTAPAGVALPDYASRLRERFENPAIRHRTWQIAMDGSAKLPQRLLQTIHDNMNAGRSSPALMLAVAGWMRYAAGTDEAGEPIDVSDPLAESLRDMATGDAAGTVKAMLGIRQVFPPALAAQLQAPVTQAATVLWAQGARAAARQVVS